MAEQKTFTIRLIEVHDQQVTSSEFKTFRDLDQYLKNKTGTVQQIKKK